MQVFFFYQNEFHKVQTQYFKCFFHMVKHLVLLEYFHTTKYYNSTIQVNVMNKSGKFWRWPQKEDKIFYTSNNIVKGIEPTQVAGSRGQFEFHQI